MRDDFVNLRMHCVVRSRPEIKADNVMIFFEGQDGILPFSQFKELQEELQTHLRQ